MPSSSICRVETDFGKGLIVTYCGLPHGGTWYSKCWFLRRAKSVWKQVFCRCERKKSKTTLSFLHPQDPKHWAWIPLIICPLPSICLLSLGSAPSDHQQTKSPWPWDLPVLLFILIVQGFLWPLSLVCVQSSLQSPSGMPSVVCLLQTQARTIPSAPLLILWVIPLKFSPSFDSGAAWFRIFFL